MRMFMTAKMFTVVALTVCLAVQAQAQQTNFSQTQMNAIKNRNSGATYSSQNIKSQIFNRAVPQFGFSSVNRGLFKGAMSGQGNTKPFSHVNQGPNSSPYLGLLSDNPFTSTTTNYFNNVRPRLEQQKMNEKLMQQNMKMQQQLTEAAARPPYDVTGSEERAPTGHAAVYQNNGGVYGNAGGYYPEVPIRSVRGQKQQ